MRFTIITINYNNAEGLRKTLASVASQTYRDFEHIIVDGGSTDDSVEIIRQYADNEAIRQAGYKAVRQENSKADKQALSPHHLITSSPITWISESDKGIYNAMNKGIEIAIGKRIVTSFNNSELVEDKKIIGRAGIGSEYVLFLNSGDYLMDANVLQMVADTNMQADVCYFDADYIYPNGTIEHHQYPDKLSFEFFWQNALCHQATWYQIDALMEMGGYDERYKIISDTAMNIDLCLINNYTYRHYPIAITNMDVNGISISKEGLQITYIEFDKYYTEKLNSSIYPIFVKYREISQSAVYRRYERLQCKFSKRIVEFFLRIVLYFDKILT